MDGSRRDFRRMIQRHRIEIELRRKILEQERAALEARLAKAREEALEELRRKTERIQKCVDAGRREIRSSRSGRPRFPRWLPRRGFDGGEPVPVDPSPKPKPLLGGAEAPID